ncbi:MAG: response regulator [Geobacteraceae bacterium]|nr:response regulator [Geobacteraceae bacterium]
MPDPLHILAIEDCNADFLMVERHLKQHGLSAICHRVDTLNALKEAISRERWDLVLADYSVPQLSFQHNLNLLQAALPDLPVIMVTGTVGEEKAVELLKLGVCDFVLKGNLARLVPAIERGLRDSSELKGKCAAEERHRQAQRMEAVGQLAGGVAHDFNNILQAIFGYSHMILAHTGDNEAVKRYVEELLKASNRAADLTRSLLAFSRKQAVTLTVIELNDVIQGNETFLRRLIREDIELKITCSEGPLTVLADRGQIEQVFMNLVANGRDAMPNGGRLSIETRPITLGQDFIDSHGYGTAGEYSSFSVSDSGTGMDRETQSHIFEPFFTTKEQGEGTGLGLSMAYGIVKKHNGFITVYSEPGRGTIFKIYLPAVHASALAVKPEVREAAPPRGGTETILVVEDDDALRRLSKNVLGHYGYHVIEAVDGQDAVDKFVAYGDRIDLVILDAIMPKKNGKLACDEMRKMRPDLHVVFVSGYTRDVFAENNVFDDNSVFIQKPVSPDVLLARVRELLDKRAPAGGGD